MTGALALLLALSAGAQPPEMYVFRRALMGTEVRVVLLAPDSLAARRAADEAFARIDSLNARLSDYLTGSELNRLSATAGSGTEVPVGADLWAVLAQAQRLSAGTGGAFDVTVGTLTRLWRWAWRRGIPPPEDALHEARAAVGWRHVRLDSTRHTVRLARPGMRLDLGGIAKGYAAQEALGVLQELGFAQALVDVGGDFAAGAPPPGAKGWTVMVAAHRNDRQTTFEERFVAERAVATSGPDYRHIDVAGVRVSHVLDPRTGRGLATDRWVTVVAPSGAEADALASACSVLEPQAALALVESRTGVEVRILGRSAAWESSGFARALPAR